MRRYDEPPLKGQYYPPRPGAYGIFWRGNALLLTAQINDQIEWQLPGGGIEAGEHPMPALTREALEETGWKVAVERKIGMYKRYVYMPDYQKFAEKICHIYVGRALLEIGDPIEPDHVPAFVSARTALDIMVNTGDREILTQFLR